MIKTVFDLEVFNLSYKLAMDIFNLTRNFPKEERYSLTDQIVRSSRSISANISEGWGKGFMKMNLRNTLFMPWVHWRKLKSGYISAGTVNILTLIFFLI